MIEQLQMKIQATFGEELGINYENGEVSNSIYVPGFLFQLSLSLKYRHPINPF